MYLLFLFSILICFTIIITINGEDVYNQTCTQPPANGNKPEPFEFKLISKSVVFKPRYLHQTPVLSDGTIVLIGGVQITTELSPDLTPDDRKNLKITKVWNSNDNGVTWKEAATSTEFVSRYGHTANAIGNTIVLIGGIDLDKNYYSDIYTSIDKGQSFQRISNAPRLFTPRYGHSAVVDPNNNLLLITGGFSEDRKFNNDVWKTSNAGADWALSIMNAPWPPRMFHTSFVRQDVFYITGGQGYDNNGILLTSFSDVWKGEDEGKSWTPLTLSAPYGNRMLSLGVSFGNSLYLIGGGKLFDDPINKIYIGNTTIYSDVWVSKDGAITWQLLNDDSKFGRRLGASTALNQNNLILIGGTNAGCNYPDTWAIAIPIVQTNDTGTIIAAILGSVVGILLVMFGLRKCQQDQDQKLGFQQPTSAVPTISKPNNNTTAAPVANKV